VTEKDLWTRHLDAGDTLEKEVGASREAVRKDVKMFFAMMMRILRCGQVVYVTRLKEMLQENINQVYSARETDVGSSYTDCPCFGNKR